MVAIIQTSYRRLRWGSNSIGFNDVVTKASDEEGERGRGAEIVDEDQEGGEDENVRDHEEEHHFSRTRKMARRGKSHLKRFGRRYIKDPTKAIAADVKDMAHTSKNQLFWSELALPHEHDKAWEGRLAAPLKTEGPLMDHLLKYSNFKRHVSRKRMPVAASAAASEATSAAESEAKTGVETTSEGSGEAGEGYAREPSDNSLGRANLKNARASTLERDAQFSRVVHPSCDLRGMDLFLTDGESQDAGIRKKPPNSLHGRHMRGAAPSCTARGCATSRPKMRACVVQCAIARVSLRSLFG